MPSIRETFTGALLATTEGIAAGRWRFTGSHGGTDILVCPCGTLGQAAPSSIYQSTAHDVFLTEAEPCHASGRHSQG